jgi:HPt (histidine-containing phosphotransfer) domain-containing protein
MAIEIPGLDTASGLDLCDGDTNIYLNALRLYVASIPVSLEKMKGVSRETLADYAITAHSVKSMSEYIGAEEARQNAKQLEALAKSGDFDGVLALNEAFIPYAQGIVAGVQDWLAGNQTN